MLYDDVCTVHNVLELKVTKLSEVISVLHKTHNSTRIAIQSRLQSWHATKQKGQVHVHVVCSNAIKHVKLTTRVHHR